ncbi:MAG: methyltransferase domain-containing protein [Pseudomonadota bacterium]
MNLEYGDIFEVRGQLYHRAMTLHPRARRREFEQLFARRPLMGGETILDLPAGGGYLQAIVPNGCTVEGYELASGFSGEEKLLEPAESRPFGSFSRVVCLAALHHIQDKASFLGQLISHTEPGGVLHAADVARDSPIAAFLDGFVGRFNGTGHEGAYLDRRMFEQVEGAQVAAYEDRDCPWAFGSQAAMLEFCTDLFGLQDCPPAELLAALERHVGIANGADGPILNWRLTYVDLVRAQAVSST